MLIMLLCLHLFDEKYSTIIKDFLFEYILKCYFFRDGKANFSSVSHDPSEIK